MSGADERARELRRRIATAEGRELVVDRSTLEADLTGGRPPQGEVTPDELAGAVLVHHGIAASADGPDRLRLRATRRYAVQGAAIVTVLAAVVGFAGRPLYGAILLVAGCAVVLLLGLRGDVVARHAPTAIPRGRILGAGAALAVIVVVGAATILPLRAHYRSTSGSGNASALVREASAAIAAGDLQTAKIRLSQAEASSSSVPGIADARADLVVAGVRAEISAAARRAAAYRAAERVFAQGQHRRAATLMRALGDWADAPARARAFARGRSD